MGVAKEVNVHEEHDGTVGMNGVRIIYMGKWRHKAEVVVHDWGVCAFFVVRLFIYVCCVLYLWVTCVFGPAEAAQCL